MGKEEKKDLKELIETLKQLGPVELTLMRQSGSVLLARQQIADKKPA